MSSEALAWAFKMPIKPSSVKFTLVALCECANYQTGRIFPSIEHICQITGQDRKTVISNISKLIELGYIIETGERVGSTGQIKVYQANIGTIPKTEQSRKRNSTEYPDKGSEFPIEESQKRDTEPSMEPSSKPSSDNKRALPGWMPIEAWEGWIEMRRAKKKPMTTRAWNMAIARLEAMLVCGQNITEVLDRSTMNGWTDLYEIKEKQNGNRSYGSPARDGLSSTARAALSVFGSDGEDHEPYPSDQNRVSQPTNRLPSPDSAKRNDGRGSIRLASGGMDDIEPFAF